MKVKELEALLAAGERRHLPGDTFMKPPKTREGNGRRTMQFGFVPPCLALCQRGRECLPRACLAMVERWFGSESLGYLTTATLW